MADRMKNVLVVSNPFSSHPIEPMLNRVKDLYARHPERGISFDYVSSSDEAEVIFAEKTEYSAVVIPARDIASGLPANYDCASEQNVLSLIKTLRDRNPPVPTIWLPGSIDELVDAKLLDELRRSGAHLTNLLGDGSPGHLIANLLSLNEDYFMVITEKA